MNESLAGDQLEVERLDPDQRLLDRRSKRDEEDYRLWCESTYGMVEVGQEVFHPADVLDRLAPDAARRGRDDASLQIRTDLEQSVCERFPVPIAAPFQAFLEGPRSALTRLHRLRDTWESLIRLLAALTLSEATRFSPFLYATDDDTGHRTRVFQFKHQDATDWHMECVAESIMEASSAAQHRVLLAPFESLLRNSREDAR